MSNEFKALLDDYGLAMFIGGLKENKTVGAKEKQAILDYVSRLEARQITPEMDAQDHLPAISTGKIIIGPIQRLIEVKVPRDTPINEGVWNEIFESMYGRFDLDSQTYSIRMFDVEWDDRIDTLLWSILDAARTAQIDILVLTR